jgi:hypothetical protein
LWLVSFLTDCTAPLAAEAKQRAGILSREFNKSERTSSVQLCAYLTDMLNGMINEEEYIHGWNT